ncbi:MAG: hypothetical protein ACLS36_01745 [Streptococcus sp.]
MVILRDNKRIFLGQIHGSCQGGREGQETLERLQREVWEELGLP